MKKILAALLSVCALCLALVGCGGQGQEEAKPDYSEAFLGVWELESMSDGDGNETAGEEMEMVKAYGVNVFIIFSEDGKGSMNMFGMEIPLTWTADSATQATLTVDESAFEDAMGETGDDSGETDDAATEPVPVTLEDGRLAMSSEGTTLYLAKSSQEVMDEYLANSGSLSDLLSDTSDALDEAAEELDSVTDGAADDAGEDATEDAGE